MPADPPEILFRYKYREMNDTNLKIITEGTLRFSSPLEFNDPFDCCPAYDMKSIEELCVRRPDLIRKVGESEGMSPAQRVQNKGKFVAKARRAVVSGDWVKALVQNTGVFCLSRNPCNALMWAHYAKNHTGFLVEFRISMDAPRAALVGIIPYPVKYVSHRPLFDWADPTADVDGYYLTKSSEWEYEEEERALNFEKGAGVYPYARELFLNSVIAGARMSESDFRTLEAVVHQASSKVGKKIKLYKAQLSSKSYKVLIPEHPDPKFSEAD